MKIDELRIFLERTQEPKGFSLNRDTAFVDELLAGLIKNRERYGYMCCPCRLSSGDRQKDTDIICPCEYRDQDVAEYGSCYCGLYVSKKWNKDQIEHVYVPERRPNK
ncbi:MAG: ferredoxin-thioredoxin reductase catalytic domain-containing protein [Dissulfurispiraceae bacterium]|jgi:ferredoxin-thioredoxin reductase catalytic subunit|nr:ferredoxin-thioredoxin reductase catalytic domain-containing protein [Dissulfurispiraceae bacterium]